MFASVSRCTEPMSTMPTQDQGHRSRSSVRSISPIPLKGFSLNFGHMFASVRWCAELITQPCWHKVKVTIQGHRFEPWISCQLCISYTSGRIFFKLWTDVHLSEMMCRINNSTMLTQGQGHSSRSWVWALNFVSALYLLYPGRIFSKLWSNVHLWDNVQNPYLSHGDSRTRSQFKVVSLSPEFRVHSISPLPLEGFSFNFGQMFASVKWCAEPQLNHADSQGHSSRSRVWALNFVSALYLLYPWEDFLQTLVKCSPQWDSV